MLGALLLEILGEFLKNVCDDAYKELHEELHWNQ